MIEHRDEHGEVCTRHAPAAEVLLAWAAVGSRISGFHHDSASKLQGMMMALDEAVELLDDDAGDVARALDTAMTSLRELHALLTENRALAKPPQRRQVALAELLQRAAARYGVKLVGDIGPATVFVAPPSIVHALAMLGDLVAGSAQAARTVTVSVQASADAVTVELAGTPHDKPSATSNEAIAVAAFLLAREDASLRCTPHGFIVQLPTRARSAADSP